MLQYFDTLTDDSGNALLGATVAVTNFAGGAPASIYFTNGTSSPIANSTVTADITGQISFFAPDGAYVLTYSYKGTQYKVRSPVQMIDPMGFVAATDGGASANNYSVSGASWPAQKYIGLKIEILITHTNTGVSTLTYQGDGGEPINQPGGSALLAGMLQATGLARLEWDGTQWQLIGSQSQPFYARNTYEISAGVTPTSSGYSPDHIGYDVRRTGADPTGAANSAPAIVTANSVGSALYFPRGTYAIASSITITDQCWFDQGAVLVPDSGVTVTITGAVIAGPSQIFNTAASGSAIAGTLGNVPRYPEWFGADPTGAANSSPAFASTLALKGEIKLSGTYLLNSNVVFDAQTTYMHGPAVIQSGLAASAGAMITVTSSGGVNYNNSRGFERILFFGTGVTGVQAMNVNPTTPNTVNNLTLCRSCTFYDFATAVELTNECYEVDFDSCEFSSCGSDNAAIVLSYTSSERNSVRGSAFFNCGGCLLVQGGGSMYLTNCSLDYALQYMITCSTGDVILQQCYVESSYDNTYWFNAGGRIFFQNCHINQTGAKPNYNWGLSTNSYGGGIFFDNCVFDRESGGADSVLQPMIAGSGRGGARNCTIFGFANNFNAWGVISNSANLCSNGTFTRGTNNLGGWTVANTGGGGLPTVSGGLLVFQVSAGGFGQSAQWAQTACVPHQNIGYTFQAKANTAADATLTAIFTAYGADGVALGTAGQVSGQSSWDGVTFLLPTVLTTFHVIYVDLPAGTAYAILEFYTGANPTTTQVSIGSVVINTY